MTNYSSWDSKATALVKEAEEEDAQEKEAADKALGLEGGPKGPPTAKAEAQMKELEGHSEKRKEFVDWSKKREVEWTHKDESEPIRIEGDSVGDMSVKIVGSEGVTYIVPESSQRSSEESDRPRGIVKLTFDKCKRVKVQVLAPLITSSMEICRCEDLTVELVVPMGTIQVDECTSPVVITFAEPDHIGQLYHQNSTGLSVGYGGAEGTVEVIGKAGSVQYFTRMGSSGRSHSLLTDVVRRGEGDFPIGLGSCGDIPGGIITHDEPEGEAPPADEEMRRKADAQRQKANDMFRASDYMQAAAEYTVAMSLDPTCAALYANRAACMMKLGRSEDALADASKCVELDPTNAKGWFRKGVSLQKLEQYPEAIQALLEAEKFEPKNEDIKRGIKFCQFNARR